MLKEKKKKVYKLKKIPRILLKKQNNNNAYKDLEEYNDHRYRIHTTKPKVDDKAAAFNFMESLNKRRALDDALAQRQIDQENKKLLIRLYTIDKLGGAQNQSHACMQYSKIEQFQQHYKKIYIQNLKLYERIKNAKSIYGHKEMRIEWQKKKKAIDHISLYATLDSIKKRTEDEKLLSMPSVCQDLLLLDSIQNKLYAYLEFSIKGGKKLGKVYVQLYQDVVPVTVQNFYEICSARNKFGYTYKHCKVHQIKKGYYLETGDITHGTGRGGSSIYGKNFTEENHILKHTKPGVLSASRIKFNENNSKFIITFNPMESLDRKNVVFGCIYKGLDVLRVMEGYARKIGKPIVDIIISDCNVIEEFSMNSTV